MRLPLHPGTQGGLQRPMSRFKRTGRECLSVFNRKHYRHLAGQGYEDGDQIDGRSCADGFSQ
jgi:hypothetical protein